ncbi:MULTISPECIES: TetR/AcrR family transcriptional regulator [Mycobacteriaceae]|uniref:TetR/AcrR family transcriptional regulator n=1 Tax=Mycolicibacterium parafortuitum TaxID=39692 RepID=A0ACC6MI12_MYCPF|nr:MULTISPECIES: TetR/AcrR family transcriptional regulator [Mycobacteriaceae]MDZ5086574.1 TetR/AcrR family transcriptional regulator [Mycolicibacterium parafortuitum]GFM20621.1 TetR family transcriptional regulator [Mycobacterium sp. PO1]GFM26202.1 TetR family transcriptional regulator [Mycobacterium sp. PO2]
MARNASAEIRRRPKDRKAQIARAAAEAFSEHGYHGVSMEAIAARVGISAAALYRHYAGKYELFRGAVLGLGGQLVDGTSDLDGPSDLDGIDDEDPRQQFDALVGALVDVALANRSSGGLYRWEGRYLDDADQAELLAQIGTVHDRIHRPLARLRPGLTRRQYLTLSTAVLSVVGSIVDHRAKLPAASARELLIELAAAVAAVELPGEPVPAEPPAASRAPAPDPSTYEALLRESLTLFHRHGYRDTGMEDIASAVGIPASGIYKYFSGKGDILAAVFRRASDRVSGELATVVASAADPNEALSAVIDSYVARTFDQPELEYVYYTERLNMSAADQRIVHDLQRSVVESWVELVVAVRPQWSPAQARFAVHAAMALVIDLGRLQRHPDAAQARAVVNRLVEAVLLGDYRLRATFTPM